MIEIAGLHILRPWGLLIIPLGLLVLLLLRHLGNSDANLIDPRLRDHMVIKETGASHFWRYLLFALSIVMLGIALSGPGWKKQQLPAVRISNPTFIVLDLSFSMAAQDVKPSRYKRALFTIRDIITDNPQNAPFALITYAGNAFQVAPLSYDIATITNFLDALSPYLLPETGSNPLAALDIIEKTLDSQTESKPTIVLISDDLSQAKNAIISKIQTNGWKLALLAIGNNASTPVPDKNGSLLRDKNNKILYAGYTPQSFIDISRATNARLANLDGSLGKIKNLLSGASHGETEQSIEQSQLADQGYIFVLALLPLMLIAARRGMVIVLLLGIILWPHHAFAFGWKDLWQSSRNQAIKSIDEGKYNQVPELTDDPYILGNALYRQGDYQKALENYLNVDSPEGTYNAGNAQFQLAQYQQAIEQYQKALNMNPGEQLRQNINNNLELAKQRLEEQKQQQQSQQQNQQQDQQQSDQQEQEQNQQQQNQQQSSQQQSDQQNTQQQEQQQQDSSQQQQAQQSGQNDQQGDSSGDQNQQQARQQNQQQQNEQQLEEQKKDQQQPQAQQQNEQTDQSGDINSAQAEQQQEKADASGDAISHAQPITETDAQNQLLLNRVNDNPSELLRRMFSIEQQQRGSSNQQSQGKL